MNVRIFYDNYLSEDNTQIIKDIKASLDGDVGLHLEVDRLDEDDKTCKIKMFDKIGVSEVESVLDKNELRELIALFRQIYNQL